jgi:anhydro-N-acetylmuramic acid kinase
MSTLATLAQQTERCVAGLMSGTSLDGIDAVVVRLAGHGRDLSVAQEAFVTVPFPPALDALVRRVAGAETVALADVARLHVRLASAYAEAVDTALDAAGLGRAALDLVGCHGQTVLHLPDAVDVAGASVRATLQLGSPATLAQHLGVPVVSDFRLADMALGGQGAPLVPYLDDALFADATETRLLLNLGGIANVSVLPAGAGPEAVRAFDTGPANMVIDACARHLLDRPYDPDGAYARRGQPAVDLLIELLATPYFEQPPPKSTGREQFGAAFVERLLEASAAQELSAEDTLATATALTAMSVYQAYARFVRPETPADVVIASGGGVHNRTLMDALAHHFAPVPVRTLADYGLDPDAKEALCFAVLAHETASGVPTSLPAVTGATRPALLGTLALGTPAPGTTASGTTASGTTASSD